MADNLQDTHSAHLTLPNEAEARSVTDALTERLSETGIAVAAFEQPGGAWAVTLYFESQPDRDAIRAVLREAAQPLTDTIRFATLGGADWVKASLEGLAPVHAGRFIAHGAHDRARVPPNKIGIEIEAALAFGTGHHGTTRGCLLLLNEVLRAHSPQRILDLGTGSGLLAIAAAKATRRSVLGSDIDPTSISIARENARLNGVALLVTAIQAVGFAAEEFAAFGPFDLTFANILANPLKALAQPMARHTARSGLVILSGLLPHQAAGVTAAYRVAGFKLLRRLTLDGWSSLLMKRVR